MNKPLFSVLVPVYNVEEYIDCCIQSLISQTYKNFEIILVDDGSKDKSGSICDTYKEHYDNIKVIHKKNQGLISARRIGLNNASGKYIVFVDSDDFLDNNALEKIHNIISKHDTDVVIYKWKTIDENNNLISDSIDGVLPEGIVSKEKVFETIIKSSSLNSLCIKAFKLELCDLQVDYSQYYKYGNSEDLLQSLPILSNATYIYYLNDSLYNYRINQQSITHVFKKERFKTLNVVRPMLYDYIKKLNLDTKENIINFYNFYAYAIWDILFEIICNLKFSEAKHYLEEIYGYEHVLRTQKYIINSELVTVKKIGMLIFYRRYWYLLRIYFFLLRELINFRGLICEQKKHF